MSEPYHPEGYAEREAASCRNCGGHPADCSCRFVQDDMADIGPPDALWCDLCCRRTTHSVFSDMHGSNKCLACTQCGLIVRFYSAWLQ